MSSNGGEKCSGMTVMVSGTAVMNPCGGTKVLGGTLTLQRSSQYWN